MILNYKMIKKIVVLILGCIVISITPHAVFAGEPTDQLKQSIDAVITVLNNSNLKGPAKAAERRAKIREIVEPRFDFAEMAKRALAIHWQKRTPEEREQFISLFRDLVEDTYFKKIEQYNDEKVDYIGENVNDGTAEVRTKVISKKTDIETPIDYFMMKEGPLWLVYDVIIEGVSLVNNYRSQFEEILSSGSYKDLVQKMKQKALREPS